MLKRPAGAADIRAVGIRGVTSSPRPAPKATCPRCGRPVALLRSARCVYCGAETGTPEAVAASGPRLPPEALIALEPRAHEVSSRSVWLRRVIALGGAGLVVALVMGPCMRS